MYVAVIKGLIVVFDFVSTCTDYAKGDFKDGYTDKSVGIEQHYPIWTQIIFIKCMYHKENYQ